LPEDRGALGTLVWRVCGWHLFQSMIGAKEMSPWETLAGL
jgi:hypothetical protein